MTTGQRIKEIRTKNDMTQAEFARIAGCTKQVISNIERGITELSADMASRISARLVVPVDELLSGESLSEDILSLDERRFIAMYRKLSGKNQRIVQKMIDIFLEQQ